MGWTSRTEVVPDFKQTCNHKGPHRTNNDPRPFQKCITKLDQVHKLKQKVVSDGEEVQKLLEDPIAACMVSTVYHKSHSTPYPRRVNVKALKEVRFEIQSKDFCQTLVC